MFTQNTLLKRVIPIFTIVIFGCLGIARALWPDDAPEIYSDAWETISGLGNFEYNPIGAIFFQISMTALGFLIFPVLLYVHPKIVVIHREAFGQDQETQLNFYQRIARRKYNVVFGSFFLFLGGVGFLLVGLIPDDTIESIGKFHEISAGLGSLGVIFAAYFYFFPLRQSGSFINQKVLWIITALWWISILLAGFAYGYAELVIKETITTPSGEKLGWYGPEWGEAGVSPFFSFSLWERILFVIIVLYLALLVDLIPEKPSKKE